MVIEHIKRVSGEIPSLHHGRLIGSFIKTGDVIRGQAPEPWPAGAAGWKTQQRRPVDGWVASMQGRLGRGAGNGILDFRAIDFSHRGSGRDQSGSV